MCYELTAYTTPLLGGRNEDSPDKSIEKAYKAARLIFNARYPSLGIRQILVFDQSLLITQALFADKRMSQ